MSLRQKPRRGVVLLVVLSLLVLFIIIAVTFAVVASAHRRSAESIATKEVFRDDPRKLLDQTLYQLLRDTLDEHSVMRGHSLLRDIYGDDYVVGQVSTAPQVFGQLVEFQVTSSAGLNSTPNFYAGCVMTFKDGPAAGVSTRIAAYDTVTSAPVFRVMMPLVDNATQVLPAIGNTVVINGRAFNGTGFGYKRVSTPAGTPQLRDLAIKPNRRGESNAALLSGMLHGGADESYDAADFQNMALAAVIPLDTDRNVVGFIVPSFHRPDLFRYHTAAGNNNLAEYVMRPTLRSGTNPNGTANANFPRVSDANMLRGNDDDSATAGYQPPWDIDNDGDGYPDSVWIDIGLPTQTDASGRRYRPLVAILCVDLDSRLNVNAHGMLPDGMAATDATNTEQLARGVSTKASYQGQGYGPAEITLRGFFSTPAEYQSLFTGAGSVSGRYGADQVAGISGGVRARTRLALYDIPSAFSSVSYQYNSSYGTPPNLDGRLHFGLDTIGQPLFETATGKTYASTRDLRLNTPYAIDLSTHVGRGESSAADNPFSVHELETILRFTDLDSPLLPQRLLQLMPNLATTASGPQLRRLVTTESFDLPVPGILTNDDERNASYYLASGGRKVPQTIQELLQVRLGAAGSNSLDDWMKLLDFDVLRGLRMNLNRPWGDGRDNNNNFVVDEFEEANQENGIWSDVFTGVNVNQTNGVDLDGNAGTNDRELGRQFFAQNLFVLMMTLLDQGATVDYDSDGNRDQEELAQQVAQWCVNVVDFRDADSVMTPFEYDYNPFNGWSVDGRHGTDEGGERRLVWGCERPELLLTETLAWHARRTEDLDDEMWVMDGDDDPMVDGPGKVNATDAEKKDADFDQRLRPRGAFFVEIFNPWTHDETSANPSGAAKPAELYRVNGGVPQGVELSRIAPGGAPVWRLAVVEGASIDRDPGNPYVDPADRFDTADIERTVYFVDADTTLPVDLKVSGAFGTTAPVSQLLPGRYAVIGSSGIPDGNAFVSPVGRLSGVTDGTDLTTLDMANTRHIRLTPNAAHNTNQLELMNNTGPNDRNMANHQPVVAVAVNQVFDASTNAVVTRSLSVSEPLPGANDYPTPTSTTEVDPSYTPPHDAPFDEDREGGRLEQDGTVRNFREVHLQRLANPLAAYHQDENPYMTIDSMLVDLTVFNGVTSDMDPNAGGGTVRFSTLERGDSGPDETAEDGRNLWKHEPASATLVASPKEATSTHYFDYYLDKHTLGTLNTKYGSFYGGPNRGAPDITSGTPGGPPYPFPAFTWNNRPYISQWELLQVPRSHSSRLLWHYSLPAPAQNPYNVEPAEFGHLLNFFDHQSADAVHYYRLLEYVHVPSRFVNTQTVFNPNGYGTVSPPARSFLTPFNALSNFREPAKININTIYDKFVFDSLINGDSSVLNLWQNIVDSRRGYGTGASIYNTNNNWPTMFGQPFRPVNSGNLVPLPNMMSNGLNCTLLRPGTTPPLQPLLSPNPALMATNPRRDAYRQGDRNAMFRYHALQRFRNLLTTRSNVYAVWTTMGYFEVDDRGLLGQELGADSGAVERHRGFAIIDRSIPVAFEPGQNNNVDRAVLLKRFIE